MWSMFFLFVRLKTACFPRPLDLVLPELLTTGCVMSSNRSSRCFFVHRIGDDQLEDNGIATRNPRLLNEACLSTFPMSNELKKQQEFLLHHQEPPRA